MTALEERERIRAIFAEELVRYDGNDAALRQFVRGFVNMTAPAGTPLVGIRPGKAS